MNNKTKKILSVALATFNRGHEKLAKDIFALAAEDPEALDEVTQDDDDVEVEEEEEVEEACGPGCYASFVQANRLRDLAQKVATAGHKDIAYRILAEAEELENEDVESEDDDEDVLSDEDLDEALSALDDEDDVESEDDEDDDEEEEEDEDTEVAASVYRLSNKIAKAGYSGLAKKLRRCI